MKIKVLSVGTATVLLGVGVLFTSCAGAVVTSGPESHSAVELQAEFTGDRGVTSSSSATGAPTVRVVGNRLVTGSGQAVRLLGVNRSGTEYACGEGWGIFDGPHGETSVTAMATWRINTVRVPLNEACWLGLSGIPLAYRGSNYRNAVVSYVHLLHRHHLMVILDLHVATPHSHTEIKNQRIADAQYSPRFWASVASAFKSDHSVVFDVFNEPHNITWSCWLNGCSAASYSGAGMQRLVNAVRSAGATQPILLGGLDYARDLSEWLSHEPYDPAHQLVASFHTYGGSSPCDTACRATVATVAKRVPVVSGEIGDTDCTHRYIDRYMAWADIHHVSYLGWTWNAGPAWTCTGGPTLITSYTGTPTAYGRSLRDHLAALH